MFTIRGADHLHVDGDLVQTQRSSPTGFETVAVAGEDLLVTTEPAVFGKVVMLDTHDAEANDLSRHPAGKLLE